MAKILYIDLDNTLVDFPTGITCLTEEDRVTYDGRYDDCPGIFALMDPVPGAIEAFERQVQSKKHLPPCPRCGNGSYETMSGGDSVMDPYPNRA